MDKYRRVEKSRSSEESLAQPNEIRITQHGKVRNYITYANGLYTDKKEKGVVLKAMGNAISKAVTVAEILKHRIAHLHQITQISSIETIDIYEPLEEGLDRIETKRHIPSISIQLSLEPLNMEDPGYQAPIPVELVSATQGDKGGKRSKTKPKQKSAVSTRGTSKHQTAASSSEEETDQQIESEDEKAATTAPEVAGSRNDRGGGSRRGRGGRGRGAGRKPRSDSKSGADENNIGKPKMNASTKPNKTVKKAPTDGDRTEGSEEKKREGDGSEAEETQTKEHRPSGGRGRGRGRGSRGRGRGRGSSREGRGNKGDTTAAADSALAITD